MICTLLFPFCDIVLFKQVNKSASWSCFHSDLNILRTKINGKRHSNSCNSSFKSSQSAFCLIHIQIATYRHTHKTFTQYTVFSYHYIKSSLCKSWIPNYWLFKQVNFKASRKCRMMRLYGKFSGINTAVIWPSKSWAILSLMCWKVT